MTATYATTLALARFMGIEGKIPDIDTSGGARSKELVGTGDDSNTLFYLDKAYVISGSYTLYYGATESAAVALTETTHYTLAVDTGTITLTGAGVTLVSTNNIYAEYSYITISLTDTQLQESLDRAEVEIDRKTNNHFANSTDATPNWDQFTEEKQMGKGYYDKDYYLEHPPIPNVTTTLDGAVTAGDGTITVVSTNGFPSSGVISIEDDRIDYTGKTATTFTGCTSVEAHDTGLDVESFAVEISTSDSGTDPTWVAVEKDVGYDIDLKTGRVHLYKDDYGNLSVLDTTMPPRSIPNRFRVSYLQGESSIPADITKVELMMGCNDLMKMAVRKAVATGNNSFNPTLINVDNEEIGIILDMYTIYRSDNT